MSGQKKLENKPLSIKFEIDTIEYSLSSSASPSDFSVNVLRQFLIYFGSLYSATYLQSYKLAVTVGNEPHIE